MVQKLKAAVPAARVAPAARFVLKRITTNSAMSKSKGRGAPATGPSVTSPAAGAWNAQLRASVLLNREDEAKLANRIQCGLVCGRCDKSARRCTCTHGPGNENLRVVTVDAQKALDQLVRANLRFAYGEAMNTARAYKMEVDDLVQEANLGLIAAAKKFDPESGNRFLTYAVWWIRAYVARRIIGDFSLVKVGTSQTQRRGFFRALRSASDGSESPLDSTRLLRHDVSIHTPIRHSGDLEHPVNLESNILLSHEGHERQVTDDDFTVQLRKRINFAIDRLPEREREVIRHRFYNPSDSERVTLQEIAIKWGVSRERVRQIELRALNCLHVELRKDRETRELLRESGFEGLDVVNLLSARAAAKEAHAAAARAVRAAAREVARTTSRAQQAAGIAIEEAVGVGGCRIGKP